MSPFKLTQKIVYLGQHLLWKLPEKEQKKWKMVERYKPDAIMEQMEDGDWTDPFGPFTDLEDYEDFWGDDFSMVGGMVYKKIFKKYSAKDDKYFEELSDKVEKSGYGNQWRVISS